MMLPSRSALLRFSLFIDASTSDGGVGDGSMVKVVVGSPCESWSAEVLLDPYSSS